VSKLASSAANSCFRRQHPGNCPRAREEAVCRGTRGWRSPRGRNLTRRALLRLQPPSGRSFLSDASHDAETANKACQSLETHGISCWLAPRDVKPGTQYADAIVRFVEENEIQVLNVAGPRASGWVAGYRFALDVVSGVIRDVGSIDLAADRTP